MAVELVDVKELSTLRVLAIIGAVLTGILLIIVGAGGAFWYLNHGALAPGTVVERQLAPLVEEKPAARGTLTTAIKIDDINKLLALSDPHRRTAILSSAESFRKFVHQERANQSVLTAAYANAADRGDSVSILMSRASQKVLVAAYLTQVVRRNLESSFPSEAQSKEFYVGNTDTFRLPERVHLWQIFIPAAVGDSAQATKNAARLAAQLAVDLQKGSKIFAKVAVKHSKHLQSRLNDGYMGLLNTAELLPEVGAAVEKLKIGSVSAPIRSQSGFHILKRGAIVADTQLEYATVKARIVREMRREAENRVRRAALKKILETFPVTVDDVEFDAWLQHFRSVEWPPNLISPTARDTSS